MIRQDIQVINRKASITVLTKDNQFTFSPTSKRISLFTTAYFTKPMLNDFETSQIVTVEHYAWSGETGAIKLLKKFGFENSKFVDILIYIIEKHKIG